MTIEEMLRRIVRAHLTTIVVCALIPLTLVVLLQAREEPVYTARARVQTVSSAPVSSAEADGLSSRVLAVATTPSIVREALRVAERPSGLDAALEAATHAITAQRLGGSSVVEVAVRQGDPVVAARVLRALVAEVVEVMNDASHVRFASALEDVSQRQEEAESRRDRLLAELVSTRDRIERENLQALLDSAQQSLDRVESEKATLVLTDANRDRVVALDSGPPVVEQVPATLLPRSALALLLGLLVGLALSACLETLRPRVAGIRVLARALDAPILGTTSQVLTTLANSLTLAARRQGVETVVLIGVDDRDERSTRNLLEAMPLAWPAVEQVPADAHVPRLGPVPRAGNLGGPAVTGAPGLRFTDRYGVTPAEEPAAGVVVVSSGTTRRRDLDAVEDLVRAMRWPVVGVVEITPRGRWLVS